MSGPNTRNALGKNDSSEKPKLPPKIDVAIQDWKIGVQELVDLYSLGKYPIYTREFDEVVWALDLIDQEEADKLYGFLSKYLDDFEWREELISGIRSIIQKFMQEQSESENPLKPCITLLLDNSWSMRGLNITRTASITHILAEELERAGIAFEILWFTTKLWKWGKSFQKWLKEWKPSNPWRLNDLRHVVYKDYDSDFKKENLGLLVREWLLKENIDGEAMTWAYERISSRTENKKVILHISDGAPVDDATQSNNKSDILDLHFTSVLNNLANVRDLELHLWALIGWDQYSKLYTDASNYADLVPGALETISSIFKTNVD